MAEANNTLNLPTSLRPNATQIEIAQAKGTMTNDTSNMSNIESNTTEKAVAEAARLIKADQMASSNTAIATGATMTQLGSVVSTLSNTTLLTIPDRVNNSNYLKQVLAKLILSQNEEVKRQKAIWYNMKIIFLKNNVEIYLDDILRMKVPLKEHYNISTTEKNITDSISRVGINSFYSKSEFQPIILGQIPNVTDHTYPPYQKIYYEHYYPLNTLALSNIKYNAYVDGDLSAFSKKYVVLPFDKELYQKNEASKYLEYVNNGGNLIVINSDNKFDGIFSKLLSIKPGNMTKFTGIETNNLAKTVNKNILNVSGIARSLEFYPNSNLTVKSYYVDKSNDNKSQNVAPFVIEKNYGKGKITFVNAIGYFDSIFGKSYSNGNYTLGNKTPYFASLSQVAPFMGMPHDTLDVEKRASQTRLPSMTRIIGDVRISPGQDIIINSSNVVLLDSNNRSKTAASYNLSADDVSVSANESKQISLTNYKLTNNKTTNVIGTHNNYYFKKALIKDLDLYGGPFQIIINVTNSTRPLYLPTTSSYNDYIAMSIPKGFDMTVKFSGNNSTYAQLDLMKKNDKNSFQRIKVSGYNTDDDGNNTTGQIVFHNVRSDIQAIRYVSALMKNPEIKIINATKTKVMENPTDEVTSALTFKKNSPDSTPMGIQKGIGTITMRIDHVDNYNEDYVNWTRTKFMTYLKNEIQITDKNNKLIPQVKQQSLIAKLMSKMPGDISAYAKEKGIEVPWRDVLSSKPSVIIALVLLGISVIVFASTWYKITKPKRVK